MANDVTTSPYWQALLANAQGARPSAVYDQQSGVRNFNPPESPDMANMRNQFAQWGLSREDAATTRQRQVEDRNFAESQRQFNVKNDLLKMLMGASPQFGQGQGMAGSRPNPFMPRAVGALYDPYGQSDAGAGMGAGDATTNTLRRMFGQDSAMRNFAGY